MRGLAVGEGLSQCGRVNDTGFADAVLVVLGHGTELNAQSAAPVWQHAAALRRRTCLFAAVQAAFWKQEPSIQAVLAGLVAPRVFIAPLFISDGYFCGQVIPEALGFGVSRVRREAAQERYYCRPIGTHESMTKVILARAALAWCSSFRFRAPPSRRTPRCLWPACNGKSAESRKAIEHQVEMIRAQRIYADVHAVFMEEEPRIAGCHALARTKHCVMVPFFISDGLHVVEDIPVLLGEPGNIIKARHAAGQPTWRNPTEKHGQLFWYASSVGTEPGVAEVILERVREAACG